MNFKNNKYLIIGCRLILGIVFIYNGYNKIVDPVGFADIIEDYKAIPIVIQHLIALIVPWIELLMGFGLILNRSIKGSIILSVGFLIMFIILLSQAYLRPDVVLEAGCGCSGNAEEKILSKIASNAKALRRIGEDIIYLFMSIYLYFIYIYNQNYNAK